MKIRYDFVTNSSSSSFILGKPGENTVTIKDAKKYLDKLLKEVNIGEHEHAENRVYCDFMIDLHYDENREYTDREVDFILSVLCWYADEKDVVPILFPNWTYDAEHDIWWWIDEDYEYHESVEDCWLTQIENDYSKESVEKLVKTAYTLLGEIIVGNDYCCIYPYEVWDKIVENKDITYKCGHMG